MTIILYVEIEFSSRVGSFLFNFAKNYELISIEKDTMEHLILLQNEKAVSGFINYKIKSCLMVYSTFDDRDIIVNAGKSLNIKYNIDNAPSPSFLKWFDETLPKT